VWQVPGQDTFVVSSPALVREAVARTEDFSSNLVSIVHDGGHESLVPFDMLPYGDPTHVIATADPPTHTRQRKVLQSHLSPSAVGAHEPMISAVVEAQLAQLLRADRPDAVADFADPVPGTVICKVLALPVSDAPRLVTQVGTIGLLLDGITDTEGMGRTGEAALDLIVYAQDHLDATTALPATQRTGLLGVIADAIDSGDRRADEGASIIVLLINAGTETTASLIATTIRTLAERPDLQADLRRHPDPHRRHTRSHPARRRPVPVPLSLRPSRHHPRGLDGHRPASNGLVAWDMGRFGDPFAPAEEQRRKRRQSVCECAGHSTATCRSRGSYVGNVGPQLGPPADTWRHHVWPSDRVDLQGFGRAGGI
jgi:cytochrome P450